MRGIENWQNINYKGIERNRTLQKAFTRALFSIVRFAEGFHKIISVF